VLHPEGHAEALVSDPARVWRLILSKTTTHVSYYQPGRDAFHCVPNFSVERVPPELFIAGSGGTPPSRAHHSGRADFHLSADRQVSALEFWPSDEKVTASYHKHIKYT
jgi:hypothetical protein